MTIHILQHAAFEDAGMIADWALDRGHTLEVTHIYKGEALPHLENIQLLILLGGPMSVHDDDAWLVEERALIARLITKEVPVLGICLGAQQIAMSLGAQVLPTPIEAGWGEVYLHCIPDAFPSGHYTVLHWHGEGFTLPGGAKLIASSPRWENQGFINGSAMALQFHLETDEKNLACLLEADSAFLDQSTFGQNTQDVLNADIPNENEILLYSCLDWMYDRI